MLKFSQKNRIFLLSQVALLTVSVFLLVEVLQNTRSQAYTPQQQASETLIAQFVDGPDGVTSQQEYSGLTTVTVSGIGRASNTEYSDAFYILTDSNGNPTQPWHPTFPYNWMLWINGQHAEMLIPNQQIPAYRGDHVYTFQINAPGGRLTFGVGDGYAVDNTGSYIIKIGDSSNSAIPYFSQNDLRWKTHLLSTNGMCSASCSTIGACGCTLTAATMLFAYYGANLTPPELNDCMGDNACPFSWGKGATCTAGKAQWVGRYQFTWEHLDQELNQNQHPVILGMHRRSNANDTHWVLVTKGNGATASNYLIHDPYPKSGADTSLGVYSKLDYVFDWISVYSGQSDSGFKLMNTTSIIPDNSRQIDFSQRVERSAFLTATATPTPIATVQTKSNYSIPSTYTTTVGMTIASGSILVYHVTEPAVIIQLSASSTAGDITEMQLWTDSNPTTGWQAFDSLAWLPWEPNDKVYAQFRDEFGNVSDVYSDSISPVFSPPAPIDPVFVYLPIIMMAP